RLRSYGVVGDARSRFWLWTATPSADRAWSRIHPDLKAGGCVHSFSPPNENIHSGLPADPTHGQWRVEVQQPPTAAFQTFYDADASAKRDSKSRFSPGVWMPTGPLESR